MSLADWAVGWKTEKSNASLGLQTEQSSNSCLVSIGFDFFIMMETVILSIQVAISFVVIQNN